jgi:anti-sigma B factor antagonist
VNDGREPIRIDGHGIKPPAAFSLEEQLLANGATAILLAGEVDMAASTSLRARVDSAADGPIVVGLGAVTFMDSSGLRELLRARIECERRGGRLILASPTTTIERLLELTGTASMFEIAPTLEAAGARLAGGHPEPAS